MVNNNDTAKVIESTKPKINPETGLELLPHVEPYTDYTGQFKRTAGDKTQWLSACLSVMKSMTFQLI